MADDLNISEQQEPEVEYEWQTPHDDIQASLNALSAVDGIDLALLSKARQSKIKAIKRMSIDIIYEQLKYIKDCIFDKTNTEELEED